MSTPTQARDITQCLLRPDKAGWWEWFEGSEMREQNEDTQYRVAHSKGQMILIGEGGTHVVDDTEYEQITGDNPNKDVWTKNYWAETETTQEMMPGIWLFKLTH